MIKERTLVIVKGSSLLGVNFGLVMEHFRFLASNHISFFEGLETLMIPGELLRCKDPNSAGARGIMRVWWETHQIIK